MSRRLIPILVLAVGIGLAGLFAWQQSSHRTGFPAPDFALPDLSGRLHQLSDYQGRIVFLNLWATWCPPCREEMPGMEKLYRRFSSQGLVMLAVSEDGGDFSAVEPFARQVGATFPILLDREGTLPPRLGITGYPETFVIDRDGSILQHIVGPEDWDSPASFEYFGKLLSTAPATQKP